MTVSAGVATYPDAGHRPRRADPARRQRALLGEGGRQEPRPRLRARVDPRAHRARSSSPTGPTAPRATAPPRASPRRSTRATPTPGSHSERVGELAGADRAPARRSTTPQVELTRLAAQPARPRQARDPGGDSPQAGRAQRRRSGSCSSAIRRSATGCSRASASSRSPTGSSTTTSAGTAPAIRTGCAASRSRSARGSSSSPTRTTR